MSIIGTVLLNKGYEASFVACVLGNINHERIIGMFETSAYISHPEKESQYLKYMDKQYSYRTKYSGKIITDVSMKELSNLIEKLKRKIFIGKGKNNINLWGISNFALIGTSRPTPTPTTSSATTTSWSQGSTIRFLTYQITVKPGETYEGFGLNGNKWVRNNIFIN